MASVHPPGDDLAADAARIGSRPRPVRWLNEVHQYSPHQAFGGHKESGMGCENSLHGLMEYTNWQTVTLNKQAMQQTKRDDEAA
jgi:acyl-CoA reductase-like NAD-dependent aldehyde dehydrogenase